MTDFETHPVGTAARIEALVKEQEIADRRWRRVSERVYKAEARAERLEAALIQMRDDRTAFRHAVHFRRFITATLKGADHD